MDSMAECFERICPSFVEFIRNNIENGWVDFYKRPEKKFTSAQYECFYIRSVRESRITIQGIHGLLSFVDDCAAHEFAHAFGAYLGREDDLLEESSGILREVFSIYAEIVVERNYRIQKKKQNRQQNSLLPMEGVEELYLRWTNTILQYIDRIVCEEKIYAMIIAEGRLDEQKINELYGEHDWVFDCMLTETEYSSIRYLIAAVLALALDKKVRKEGNKLLQGDIDLWRDVPKLTGEAVTKQMWDRMIEEFLLEPMQKYIQAIEKLKMGDKD